MRAYLLALFLLLLNTSYAQEIPDFKPLRYNEDYSSLGCDTNKTNYKKLKHTPLSKNGKTYISLGGEARYQYFGIDNENWQDLPWDSYLLSRFLFHTDVHTSERFRFFMQLQASMANEKASGTSPVDENPLDLHQAFIDVNNKTKSVILRLGRQEMLYGSQRLISVREGPNNRQSFDAARGLFSFNNTKADFFYARYVRAKKGDFDDLSDKDVNFWGTYWVTNKVPIINNIDLYYLGLSKTKVSFNDGEGKERRHSLGTRIWANTGRWRYDFEGVYQFGNFTGKLISAWTISSNSAYTFKGAKLSPEFGLKTEVISGDQLLSDTKLHTFNPLFPRGAYFGLAALIGPANLVDIHPSLSLDLIKDKLNWTIDYDAFWRHKVNDGIYGPNGSPNYPSGGSRNKFIGQQLATYLNYTPNNLLSLALEVTWFNAAAYLKDVSSGGDILFFGVTTQLKF